MGVSKNTMNITNTLFKLEEYLEFEKSDQGTFFVFFFLFSKIIMLDDTRGYFGSENSYLFFRRLLFEGWAGDGMSIEDIQSC